MQSDIDLGEKDRTLLAEEAEERSKIYMLLGTFYLMRPKEEFIRKLKTDEFIQTLNLSLSEVGSDMADALRTLAMFINSIKDIPESEVAENLSIDFTRLFRGIKKGYGPPPPYESVWRGEGRIMGEWTQRVLEKYHEAGIGMDLGGELPDYIGIELKFMSRLSYEEFRRWKERDLSGAKKALRMEGEFLEKHIQMWLPAFIKHALAEARTGFYRAVLELTGVFIRIDHDYLSSLNHSSELSGNPYR